MEMTATLTNEDLTAWDAFLNSQIEVCDKDAEVIKKIGDDLEQLNADISFLLALDS